jgi:hypothetical protein
MSLYYCIYLSFNCNVLFPFLLSYFCVLPQERCVPLLMPSKAQKAAAARAQAAKSQQPRPGDQILDVVECTGWTGGVNHVPSDTERDSDDEDWKDTDLDGGDDENDDDDDDLEDLEGEDLLESLQNKWVLLQQEIEELEKPTPYEHILKKTVAGEWKKAEAQRGLGYNGQSARWKREIAQKMREKEESDKVIHQR